MTADELRPGDYTTTPDGYSCQILTTAGKWIGVYLTHVHWPRRDCYRWYPKTHWI